MSRRASVEERDEYYANVWPLTEQSMVIVNSWYMRPVFYLAVHVVRPVCLLVARVRQEILRRKWRKIAEQG